MNDHYHLALETPEPNPVEGMRWLQGAFGIRFNAFHGQRGHIFQSRYKRLLIEGGRSLMGLVNYVHLNPVRAGIVELAALRDFTPSSFPKFFAGKPPLPLDRSRFLAALEFPDSTSGMKNYARHLEFSQEHDPTVRDEIWVGPEVAELRKIKWERLLSLAMKSAGKTRKEAREDLKSAKWKVRIARELRRNSTATNGWIAEHLHMVHPTRVSNLVSANM